MKMRCLAKQGLGEHVFYIDMHRMFEARVVGKGVIIQDSSGQRFMGKPPKRATAYSIIRSDVLVEDRSDEEATEKRVYHEIEYLANVREMRR